VGVHPEAAVGDRHGKEMAHCARANQRVQEGTRRASQ
jgi:hypothetical protein